MIIEVDRSDLHRMRVVPEDDGALAPGTARLRIDAFGLTANNVSYAAFGDMLRYWDFFPAAPADDDTLWGRVPVWGFADVVESNCAELAVGRRVYGYLPMGETLVIEPGRFDDRGCSDVAAHRAEMAGAYSRYLFVDTDPAYRPDQEDARMGLWPLFFTSFVVDDFLGDVEFRGARQVVLSSASSKTAIALAFLLSRRPGIDVVGLTSASNAEFVAGLGCYSSTVRYGDEATIATAPSVFVDFAGNADVRNAVHEHLGADLTYSMVVGGTHWDHTAATNAAPVGPRPEFFFAPTQIAKRTKEWGQAGLDDRMAVAWTDFATWTNEWVHHVRPRGAAEVQAAFAALVRGVIDPSATIVATMAS